MFFRGVEATDRKELEEEGGERVVETRDSKGLRTLAATRSFRTCSTFLHLEQWIGGRRREYREAVVVSAGFSFIKCSPIQDDGENDNISLALEIYIYTILFIFIYIYLYLFIYLFIYIYIKDLTRYPWKNKGMPAVSSLVVSFRFVFWRSSMCIYFFFCFFFPLSSSWSHAERPSKILPLSIRYPTRFSGFRFFSSFQGHVVYITHLSSSSFFLVSFFFISLSLPLPLPLSFSLSPK